MREHRERVTLLSQSGIQKSQAGAIVPEGNGSGLSGIARTLRRDELSV